MLRGNSVAARGASSTASSRAAKWERMHYVLILNPVAGHGRVRRKQDALRRALDAASVSYEVRCTEAPGHAVALAHAAAAPGRAVVAVGGDGTVHEVARGLVEQGGGVPLGVIPMGTGNDFVKTIGMPSTPDAAVDALLRAQLQQVDHGWVRWEEHGQEREQVFVNAVGIGFDARVAYEARAFKRLPGMTGYLAAVFRTLRRWTSPRATVTAETAEGASVTLYAGALLLTTVGNGVSSGGAFYLTPHASIQDGVLDACVVAHASPWRILQVLPRALRGQHTAAPEVRMAAVRSLHLRADAPIPLHADGEGLSAGTQRMDVRIVEGGLRVLAAPGHREN